MSSQKDKFLCPRSRSQLGHNQNTTGGNLTKRHRKIDHYGTVCRAQDLSSYAQGQAHRSDVKIMSKQNSKTTEAYFAKLHGKIEHKE